jgi:hypothetical protein
VEKMYYRCIGSRMTAVEKVLENLFIPLTIFSEQLRFESVGK